MKPTFATLSSNYSSNELLTNYRSGAELYAEMGLDHEALIKQNPAYINTCAGRASFFQKIKGRKGVVLFWKISGYGGRHVDLFDSSTANAVCSSGCY